MCNDVRAPWVRAVCYQRLSMLRHDTLQLMIWIVSCAGLAVGVVRLTCSLCFSLTRTCPFGYPLALPPELILAAILNSFSWFAGLQAAATIYFHPDAELPSTIAFVASPVVPVVLFKVRNTRMILRRRQGDTRSIYLSLSPTKHKEHESRQGAGVQRGCIRRCILIFAWD